MAPGMGNYLPISGAFFDAPRRGARLQVTSSTAERSPFPSRGRTKARLKMGKTANVGRDTCKIRRAKCCRTAGLCKSCSLSGALKPSPCRRRGTAVAVDEVSMDKCARYCKLSPRSINPAGRSPTPSAAMRRGGGLEGFTPPHRFKARTAASDGHCAFTRACA